MGTLHVLSDDTSILCFFWQSLLVLCRALISLSSDLPSWPKCRLTMCLASSVAWPTELAINLWVWVGNSRPWVPANSSNVAQKTNKTAFVIPVSCRNALASYAGYAQLHLLCLRSHPDQRLQWRKSISAPSMALALEGLSYGKSQSVDHASVDTATSPQWQFVFFIGYNIMLVFVCCQWKKCKCILRYH